MTVTSLKDGAARDGKLRSAATRMIQEKPMAKPPKKTLPKVKEDGKGDRPKGKVDMKKGGPRRKA